MTIQDIGIPARSNILSGWTDERIDRLKILLIEGYSSGAIAADIGGGLSRNAVIGKVNRLGLRGTRPAAPCPAVSMRPRTSSGRLRRKSTGGLPIESAPALSGDEPTDIVVEFAPTNPIRFIDSTDQTCKWPLDEPTAAMLVCGDPVRDQSGCPYCSFHARVAYVPSAPRKDDYADGELITEKCSCGGVRTVTIVPGQSPIIRIGKETE